MSDYVAHFTKVSRELSSAQHMHSILLDGRIDARSKFGLGRYYAQSPHCVCLSEVPVHFLERIMRRRGAYGLAFTKAYVAAAGGGPILYAYGPQAAAAQQLYREALDASPIWTLAPFIDAVLPNYSFEWEREWRVPGDLAFTPADVSFMMFPEDEHDRVSEWLAAEAEAGRLPRYQCPLIDVTWPADRIAEALV